MRVNLPYKLSSMRTVTAAQLKAMYDAVATVVNGNLTRDNFARRAGIAIAHKAAPRSWLVLEQQLPDKSLGDGAIGASTMRWLIPTLEPSARRATITAVSWSVVLGPPQVLQAIPPIDPNPVFNYDTGTVKLRHLPAGGTWADKDSWVIAAGTRDQRSGVRGIAPLVVAPGDVLEVRFMGFSFQAGGLGIGSDFIAGASAAVWLKMNHLP